MKSRPRSHRSAFTLFEVILAVSLSAALLGLIGTAINLYLMRIEADRSEVEEAQLARSILAMISADLRAATVYQPQDMGAIGQLMSAAAEFDVDSIDDASLGGGGGGFSGGASGGGGLGGGSGSSGGQSPGSSQPTEVIPVGLNGMLYEMSVDVSRLPDVDDLFSVPTGYMNAPSLSAEMAQPLGTIPRPSDVKTVRYFVRQGAQISPGSLGTTSLAPEEQLRAGGLVRQEIDRASRNFAEVSGNQGVLETGQVLLAPEVASIEFRYFDGTGVADAWDMAERGSLPIAVEIRLVLRSTNEAASNVQFAGITPTNAREYRQTVYLPLAMNTAASGNTSGSGTGSSSGSGSSTSGGTGTGGGFGSSGTGSGFGAGTGAGGGTGGGSGFGQGAF